MVNFRTTPKIRQCLTSVLENTSLSTQNQNLFAEYLKEESTEIPFYVIKRLVDQLQAQPARITSEDGKQEEINSFRQLVQGAEVTEEDLTGITPDMTVSAGSAVI